MLFQRGNNQPFLENKLLGNDVAVITFRILCRFFDIGFQIGIFKKDDKQTVLAVQLLQIGQLAVHAAHPGKIGIEYQEAALIHTLVAGP